VSDLAPASAAAAAAPASAPPAARAKATPAPGAAPAAPAPGRLGEAQLRELYDAYVAAKRRCNEDVSKLSYEAVAKSVTRQIPELMQRFRARSVDFKVVIKDGKAILKAIPRT
jgi:hypothetical protein